MDAPDGNLGPNPISTKSPIGTPRVLASERSTRVLVEFGDKTFARNGPFAQLHSSAATFSLSKLELPLAFASKRMANGSNLGSAEDKKITCISTWLSFCAMRKV